MLRPIARFEQDDASDWVAVLACGHRQHMRHRPPTVDRAWVLDPAQRDARLGSPINCKECETAMSRHATGPFDVKLAPLAVEPGMEDTGIGRMSLDKQFHGDLEATSKGQMTSSMGNVKGSAGYVAMEKVRGTLHGRSGTFVLQHFGLMTRGEGQLTVSVVPDSGTDELAGLAGSMKIIIEGGKHSYAFDYTLEGDA